MALPQDVQARLGTHSTFKDGRIARIIEVPFFPFFPPPPLVAPQAANGDVSISRKNENPLSSDTKSQKSLSLLPFLFPLFSRDRIAVRGLGETKMLVSVLWDTRVRSLDAFFFSFPPSCSSFPEHSCEKRQVELTDLVFSGGRGGGRKAPISPFLLVCCPTWREERVKNEFRSIVFFPAGAAGKAPQ